MKPFICENWHAWESNESLKKLYSYRNMDEAINWLYVHGNRTVARALNSHKNNTPSCEQGANWTR